MKLVINKQKFKKKKIGDIVNFKRGYDLPFYQRQDGPYPIVSSSGITGYHNEYKVEGEGLVTGRYGTLGEMYYVNGKYWPHNTALYVTDFKGNYPKYVYFLMKSLISLQRSDKSAVPGINRNDLHEILVPYIEKPYQKEIADSLFIIENKISINLKINSELEQIVKSLYNYWFVQYDFSNKNSKPYKISGGKMEFNKELKREIPHGWKIEKLKSLFNIYSGYPFSSDIYEKTGAFKLITIKNVQNKFLDTTTVNYLKELPHNLPNYCKLNLGDLLISLTGNIGRICIVTEENLLLNQRVGLIAPKNGNKTFVYFLLQSDFIIQSLKKIATGSNQKNLSPIDATEIRFLKPNDEIIKKFESKTKPIFDMILKNQVQNQELVRLRDFLLPLLMNGQVNVKDSAK